jgi:hypothetical protein
MTGFEIRDPEIDSAALAERMAMHITVRRTRAAELDLDFEELAGLTSASGLDEALALIQLACGSLHMEPRPHGRPVRSWRHPLRWFKQELHALVIYYVNRLAYRQMIFNNGVLQLLEHLLAEHKADVTCLRVQVADLTERLLDIEPPRK